MEHKNIFKEGVWKVFEVFVDEPTKVHFVKEISKKINLAPTSVKIHLQKLENKEIVIRKKGDRFLGYISNRDNEGFLFYKKIFNLIKIKESGVVESIIKNFHPKTIILYGSYLRGEDREESDIDFFVVSEIRKLPEIGTFEKVLKRKIHILIEKNLSKINLHLKKEVINGTVLFGYLKDG